MIKKIVPALWAILLLIALGYVIRVICFTPIIIPETDYVVTGATEMVSGPAAASASGDSNAPAAPPDAGPAPSTESVLSAGAENMVEGVISERANSTAAFLIDIEIALRSEMKRRQAVIKVLAAYAEKKDALKEELRRELGDITTDKIDGLVARAKELEAQFWAKGDFDSPASFDSIYEARALLGLCLEADPRNESALRSMVSVVCSGWPSLLRPEDLKDADPALRERNSEGLYALQRPLMTLWQEYVSKSPEPTIDDLAVAQDVLNTWPPHDEVAKFRESFEKEHPGGGSREWLQAEAQWRKDFMLPIVDWLLDACKRKGPEWDYYAEQFSRVRENVQTAGYARFSVGMWFDPTEPMHKRMRYWGRPSVLFRGPEERAAKQQPFHILLKDRRIMIPSRTRR